MVATFVGLALLAPTWYGTPPERAERIASLAPSLTETLFALGAGDRVVAVSQFDDHPPAVESLPRLGGVGDLSVEAVLALAPDLVVSVRSERMRPVYRRLATLGVPVATFDGERIAAYRESVRALGVLLGRQAQARALLDRLDGALARERSTPLAGERVIVLVAHAPLFAATGTSYHGDVVRALGGEPVPAGPPGYVQLGLESLVALRPAVVIDLSGRGGNMSPVPIAGRWISLSVDGLKRLGPRLASGVDALVTELESSDSQ